MGSGRGGGNNKSNNNNGGGGGGFSMNQIPPSSKKMIQSIKEIVVDFSDDEIYAMLKDCNMDPSDAVNRLLTQDTFHEVKSKREKKKEIKDVTDTRSRGSSTSTRGGRSGADRYSSRSNTTPSDYAAPRARPAYKKENGPPAYTNSTTGVTGNNVNRRQTAVSDTSADKPFSINAAESILPTPQPTGYQSAWSGMPAGQVSMADIVKKGRPQAKTSSAHNVQQYMNSQHDMPPLPASVPYDSRISQNYATKVSEVNPDSEIGGHQHVPPNDEWALDEEPPAANVSSVLEASVESEQYTDPYDRTKQQFRSQADDVRYEEDDTADEERFVGSVPGSNQIMQENNSVNASGYDNGVYQNIGSYQVHHHEVEDPNVSVSSMTNNFESLSLPKDEEDTQSEDDAPAVKIPDHLQVQTADLSHLSFGSFGTGLSAPFSGSFPSRPEDEAAVATEAPSVGHSEARNSEYYEEDHLRSATDGNNGHRMGAGPGNFEASSNSQTDMLNQEVPEVAQSNQYSFPSATANYSFENSQQLNSSFGHSPTSSQMQGLPSMSGVMPYSSSLPSTLLASNMQQPLREAELAYSQFPISQSMAAKYGNSVSSLGGPTASMAEALKSSNLAAQQPTQTLPGGGVSGATGLPQHLAMHPYSQHSVPLGPLNMMGYPFMPQNYTYMPSAFQQAFAAGNSTYPQSLAAVLPQYKNNVSVSSLTQSAAVPSGYGDFGNSNNIPNNFPLNPPSAPAGTSMNYDDVLRSQYKDASHLLSLQQQQQQGPGSRTMSGVPGNTYYSFQGQNQQPAGFRQTQQPSQHYGQLSGYPNYYHSQAGLSLEHQQQMSRDGSLGGSQGQQPKQTQQQIWQNSY